MIIKRDFIYTPKGTSRPLHIYLPDNYFESEKRYPVMYFFDGHNLFFNEDATLKAKLVAATWSVEEQNDHQLMGLCTLHLRENITLEEKEILRDWVLGQNADGAFESLEDYPIETGEGTLRVSLWNDGDDYFVKDRMELDEYIAQQSELKIGGM